MRGGGRGAPPHDPYSAERARKSNDAQVLTMGARVIAPQAAEKVLDHWLASEFEGGGSTSKVEKMKAVDARYRGEQAGSA
jgi:ribose 5-phosphate isomerase B